MTKNIPEMIVHFKRLEENAPSMAREVKWQFLNMAEGGKGDSSMDGPSIREEYYPSRENDWFQEVCDLMSWVKQ